MANVETGLRKSSRKLVDDSAETEERMNLRRESYLKKTAAET